MDPSRASISKATIQARDVRQGRSWTALTDDLGYYHLIELPPSVYEITATASGFAASQAKDVVLNVNGSTRVDFHLALASRGDSIRVEATVHNLETESSDLGATIDQARVDMLPLNRRDFLQLALLTPGVLPPVQGSELSTRGSFAMHANGAREEFNNFLLDGVDNNDQDVNRYVLQPPVDAVQEFKIETSNYSAVYGRNAGGQVNVITRSGGNALHGFGYDYLRNKVLDARNFFDGPDKPKYIRNQFGGGVGGPVVKDRTFYFFNVDSLQERQGLTRLATVPTLAERSGDLSALGTAVDPFAQQPFPNNRIPDSRMSPVALQILKLFPLPNRPGDAGNYLAQPVGTDSVTQFNGKLDHKLTDIDQLTLRYSWGRNELFEPYAENTTNLPGFGDFVGDRGHNAMIHYVRTFSPTVVNSLLLGFNRAVRQILVQNHATDVNQAWGVNWLPSKAIDFGYPAVSVAGFDQVGDQTSLPISRTATTYQLTEMVSMNRGQHGLTAGVELRKFQHNGIADLLTRGSISFPGAITGVGMADLLLGFPTFALQSQTDNTQTLRTTATNLFVQDDWKVRRNLTLNLGLRYEYNTPATDPTNRMTVFNLQTLLISQVGSNGVSRSGYSPDYTNFAPRVGFAWSPAELTVVRGGYGIYYDAGMAVVNTSLYFNPPYFNIRVFFPSQTSLLTLDNPFPLTAGFVPPASLSTLSPDLTTAYLQHWNFNIQHEFTHAGTLSIAYSGSKGTHLIRSRDVNQPPPGPGDVDSRRPYQGFSHIFYIESGANSNYHSLQLSFNRPFRNGLALLAGYTFSKSIDNTTAFLGTISDKNFPQDSSNYGAERALSSFDTPHRATIAAVYHVPSRNRILRNFESSAIFTAQSGQPFTPLLRFDNSNSGNDGQFGNDRPNVVHPLQDIARGPNEWFDTSAFAVPPQYTFGSAGRNILRGPAFVSMDLSVQREFKTTERFSIIAGAQAFNTVNRANFSLPQLYADEPTAFGRIFSAKAPRQIQLFLRLAF
jgi:Carboxypeptidase regulatory-like domain/TonB dependent receptor